jgi:hypothetical protein
MLLDNDVRGQAFGTARMDKSWRCSSYAVKKEFKSTLEGFMNRDRHFTQHAGAGAD